MSGMPRISESEWEIMECLWQHGRLTANEIVEQVRLRKDWQDKTIKTLLNRLLNKRVIRYEKQGRSYLYEPVVERRQCVQRESRSLLQRLYGGRPLPLLVQFLEEEQLSPQEIDELRRLLDRQGEKP